ncbi:MAG: hypothetical protein JOZ72_10635 [Alphaproteobacteria bacterium]|nr:hypothetical protein [Alphaproteobacteria bacterium]
MRTSFKVLMGLSSLLLTGAAVADPVLVPVTPFPNASTTSVFGIADDNNTIAGSYVDQDGISHGFYGTLDGNYTSFDYPDGPDTQARAIDGGGMIITGFSNIAGAHCELVPWEYGLEKGKIKRVSRDGVGINGIVQGINKVGAFAGDYCDGEGVVHGSTDKNYRVKRDVDTGISSSYTGERAFNGFGTSAGFYVNDNTGLQIGTLVDKDGNVTTITYPDANESYTVFEGLNDHNRSDGQWGDTSGIVHSFEYNTKTGNFTEIDDPFAASFTQAWGMNSSGLIAVTSDAGPYIYCPKENSCPLNTAHAIRLNARVVHGEPGATRNHAPSKHVLPKGAARQ